MSTHTKEETELEFGTAEVTLTFLVSHLNWKEQNGFIEAMAKESFGIAAEGTYYSLDPPLLVGGKLLKTVTFTFTSLPYVKQDTDLMVAVCIGDALTIARKHNASLLTASHRLDEGASA